MQGNLSVTVGITTYNASEYISQCLKSIADQTIDLELVEVIVVDDGSSDDSASKALELIESLDLNGRVLTQTNTGGPSTGRNRILDEANFDYVFFIDVDDYLDPRALKSMLELAAVEDADVVIGKFEGVNRGAPKLMFKETLAKTNLSRTPVVDSLNVLKMFRTNYARSLGYRFNPNIRMAEDHPFALAAYAQTDKIAIQADHPCYYWVRHETEQGKAQHLTGHILPVQEFYKYFYESFNLLHKLSRNNVKFADELTGRYWHRLLYLDLPNEFRRARNEADFHFSVVTAQEIIKKYHAAGYTEYFSTRTKTMLRAIELGDSALIKHVSYLLK